MEVPAYACRAQRWQLLAQCLATEAAYLAAVGLLASRNLVAALWVFIIPYLLTSLALMFGNWCVLRVQTKCRETCHVSMRALSGVAAATLLPGKAGSMWS